MFYNIFNFEVVWSVAGWWGHHAGGEAGARGADHADHRGRPPRLYTCGDQRRALPSGYQPVRLQSNVISVTLSY